MPFSCCLKNSIIIRSLRLCNKKFTLPIVLSSLPSPLSPLPSLALLTENSEYNTKTPLHSSLVSMSVAMASADQPLKKRKVYETITAEPVPDPPPPPLSEEEILQKQRNRDEIRNVYNYYSRIRYCISQKDSRLMPDLEQAYLSLITASRGCTSVQRLVSDFIPRYASYCPTALEAAAQVVINMYSWNLAIIARGDDFDGVSFQTARACIFGLVDICSTASTEAPTSSVIQGICSAVFKNVLSFFISTFEGKDIYQIDNGEIESIKQSKEIFLKLKETLDGEESVLSKLFKFRAVCLLRIFFSCPRDLLAACFELLESSGTDVGVHNGAFYFLRQATSQFNTDVVTHQLDNTENALSIKYNGAGEEKPVSSDNLVSEKGYIVSNNCWMGMVVSKVPSLKGWIFSRYNKLCKTVGAEILSEVSSCLEQVFSSFSDLVREEASREDGDEDSSDSSKFISQQYLMPNISNSAEINGRDNTLRAHETSAGDAFNMDRVVAGKVSGHTVKPCPSLVKPEASVNESSNHECEFSVPMKHVDTREHEDSGPDRGSMHNMLPSPAAKRSLDLRSDSFKGRNNIAQIERNQLSTNILSSPRQHSSSQQSLCSTSQIVWYSDGDPLAMDVFSASKLLWLGCLGHDASENLVRTKFERFGPIEHFLFVPFKGFALVEYRKIMDAVKAREYMRGSAPWGSCLRIKFLDAGLGSRGAINGAAIGSSCHVYVGKVPSQWAKDEILHDLVKAGLRTPRMVTDLPSESALLLEFETAEEAASVMAHIRQHRKENGYHVPSSKRLADIPASRHLLVRQVDLSISDEEMIKTFSQFGEVTGWKFVRQSGYCLIDFRTSEAANVARSHLDGARFGPSPIRVEFRTNDSGNMTNTAHELPHAPILNSPVESSKNRMSQLSAFFMSLCKKYNLSQSSGSLDGCISRNYHGDVVPTNTLWIGLPDFASPFFTDDDIMSICNVAVGNVGSISRLTRANMHRGFCWFVEFNNVDAAITVLKNVRDCPGMFFQIEFRNSGVLLHPDERQIVPGNANSSAYLSPLNDSSSSLGSQQGKHHMTPVVIKSEVPVHELVSPRINLEKRGIPVQSGHAFPSNWSVSSSMERMEVESQNADEKIDSIENNLRSLSLPGQVISHTSEQVWMYKKPEIDLQMSAPGTAQCLPPLTQGAPLVRPLIQAPSFLRPVYLTPNSSWDMRCPNPSMPLNQIPPNIMHGGFHVNVSAAPPLLPSPVTPLARMPGSTVQRFDQMLPLPTLPPLSSPPPPLPDMPPPLPPSPPPLPLSQPPSVPPPPISPPPQQIVEASNSENSGQCLHYKWLGVLCKSGVHYCTIFANREETDACKYTNAMSEPAEWPAKLDVTKRTDFRHVKSTFSSTPPNKREVCRLLPSTTGDLKGLQDFLTYLKQRECAGVIKIPAGKSIWARLLFILPCSQDMCSMLGIAPYPVECLIGLVLPKEKNFEWL